MSGTSLQISTVGYFVATGISAQKKQVQILIVQYIGLIITLIATQIDGKRMLANPNER
jgi:hypothetical protein